MNDTFQVGQVGWSPDYNSNNPSRTLEAETLCDRMCGYSTAYVSDAIIAYFKLPDCSQTTRQEIFNYLSQNSQDQERP